MIFAIIDLLEKLLGWLKPFAAREKVEASPSVQAEPAAPSPNAAPSPAPNPEPSASCGRARPDLTLKNLLSGAMEFTTQESDLDGLIATTTERDAEVLADLAKLMKDKEKNRIPLAWGSIYESGTGRMITSRPVKAGLSVWYSLDITWRGKYVMDWKEIR
jgi:hypothetical protein